MLVSIIIPAYNVQSYIAACLDSCLAQLSHAPAAADVPQTLHEGELEFIVVDDGSTDDTPSILAQYAALHPCIRIMRQANQGQSVARNLAIASAQGDYIYMVDSDDQMIAPAEDAPSVLPIDTMRTGLYDIIGLQVYYQPEDGKRRPWSRQMEHWPFGRQYQRADDFVRCHNIEGLVYGYVFRRTLFTAHPELRFTPGIYHQDEELIFKIFTIAGPTIYLQGYTYIYYEHTGSSLNTRTEQRRRKLMDDFVTILQRLIAWRDRYGTDDAHTTQLRGVMHYKLSYLAMDMLRMLVRQQYDEPYILEVIASMRQLGLYPLPHIDEARYRAIALLTCRPQLVVWWAKHHSLSRRIGF